MANLFERGISPYKAEFPEVKIKRQIIDHYLKGICNLTHQYGTHTIEIQSPSKFHGKYLIQTDDVDIEDSRELSKSFIFTKTNFQQPTTTSVNFHDYPRTSEDQSENYPFFQQKKNKKQQNQSKH